MPGKTPHVRTGCGAEGWHGCRTRVATGSRGRRRPRTGARGPSLLSSARLLRSRPGCSRALDPGLGAFVGRCSGLVRTAARGLLPCRPAERGPLRPSCATHSLAPASSPPLPFPRTGSLRLWACSYLVYQPAHPPWALARVCQRQGPFWCPAGAGSELGERLGRGNNLTRPEALVC